MKKTAAAILSLLLMTGAVAGMADGAYTPGTYRQSAKGMGGDVVVDVTFDADAMTAIDVVSQNETAGLGDVALTSVAQAMLDAQSADVDGVAGATVSSTALKQAVSQAIAEASGKEQAAAHFVPGAYTTTAQGNNGAVTVETTFSEDKIEKIEVVNHYESQGVCEKALFTELPQAILDEQSLAVDTIAGATVASNALISAVRQAAEQAGCDVSALMNAPEKKAPETTEYTADVIIVGAGGAGLSAAVAATDEGASVILIEKEGYVGGNTLVSGGQYQSVMPYLVWDPADPDATTGVGYDGNTYNKVVESVATLDELKTILNWSEEPFDEGYYKDHEFVAGDIAELSKHGVHAEYLQTLKDLKAEIQAYLDWAEPKVEAGAGQLTLFSTVNLHIFQTYYGGLRPSADMSSWIYGDYDLVKQFIEGGQTLKQ